MSIGVEFKQSVWLFQYSRHQINISFHVAFVSPTQNQTKLWRKHKLSNIQIHGHIPTMRIKFTYCSSGIFESWPLVPTWLPVPGKSASLSLAFTVAVSTAWCWLRMGNRVKVNSMSTFLPVMYLLLKLNEGRQRLGSERMALETPRQNKNYATPEGGWRQRDRQPTKHNASCTTCGGCMEA